MLGRVGLPAWAPRGVKVGTLSIVAASLVLAVMIVSWPHLFSSGSRSPRPAPGQIGEAEGWVKSAAPSTNTIRVSSGFLGLSSVALVVTLDTLIIVGGKEGGFDDVHEGRRVRAAYEVRPDGLRAKSIEVVVDGAQAERRQAIGPLVPKATELSTSTVRHPADDSGPRRAGSTSGPLVDQSSPGERFRKPLVTSQPVMSAVASPSPAPVSAPRADKGQTGSQIEPRATSETGSPTSPPKVSTARSAQGDPGRTTIVRPAPSTQPSTRRPIADDPPADDRRPNQSPGARSDGALHARDTEPRQAPDPTAVIDWLLKESPLGSQ